MFGIGFFATAGVSAAGGSYDLLETVSLSSSAASVTFSNLNTYASTYQHLQIRMAARNNTTNGPSGFRLRINSDSGNNYSWHYLFANGSSVSSAAGTSTNYAIAGVMPDNSGTANVFNAAIIDVLDVYETKNKTIRTFSGHNASNGQRVSLYSGLWNSTASVTSLSIFTNDDLGGTQTFVAGSRFSLYGIKGA